MVNKNIIIKSIEDAINKCSKPHISALPGDGRTNNVQKLEAREKAINKELAKVTKKMVRQWKNIVKMVDEWNKNIPKDEDTQLVWEGVYGLGESNLDYLLDCLEISLKASTRSKDFISHRTDSIINTEDFLVMDMPNWCDIILKWSNEPWDWEGFNINNMDLFKKRIKSLKKQINIYEDYTSEKYKVDSKLLDYRIHGERVDAKVSNSDEVYDLAKRTRGIQEIHNEGAEYDDDADGGMFTVVTDDPKALQRLVDKVGATEVHEEEDGLYTILMPYKP